MQNHTLSLSRQVVTPTHCIEHALLLMHCEDFGIIVHLQGMKSCDLRPWSQRRSFRMRTACAGRPPCGRDRLCRMQAHPCCGQ